MSQEKDKLVLRYDLGDATQISASGSCFAPGMRSRLMSSLVCPPTPPQVAKQQPVWRRGRSATVAFRGHQTGTESSSGADSGSVEKEHCMSRRYER